MRKTTNKLITLVLIQILPERTKNSMHLYTINMLIKAQSLRVEIMSQKQRSAYLFILINHSCWNFLPNYFIKSA